MASSGPGSGLGYNVAQVKLNEGEMLCNCSNVGCGSFGHKEGEWAKVCKTDGGCQKVLSRPDQNNPDYIVARYNCIKKEIYTPPGQPIPCKVSKGNEHRDVIGCCHDENFCNGRLSLSLAPPPTTTTSPSAISPSPHIEGWMLGLVVGVPFFLVVCILLAYFTYRRRYPREKPSIYNHDQPLLPKKDVLVLNSLVNQMNMGDLTSGSGSGLPLLEQRRVARQIELLQPPIGEGRFGVVHKGVWKGESVAVKIFQTTDEKSWFREVEIYQTSMLRHANILAFFASDNKDAVTVTQLWLVTEYHPLGSLFDYLERATIPTWELCLKIRSIANGLSFLHSEIVGFHCKPAIAHRDLKSKNILVRGDGQCCIADLGLAVRYSDGQLDLPGSDNVGTRRYCAPEVLDDSLVTRQFDGYKAADIYSLGLIIWELCRRTNLNGLFDSYELPYYDLVRADPSLEEMRRVVCTMTKRPTIPNRWMNDPVLQRMSQVMKECWAPSPSARLSALRVKKTVDSLSADNCKSVDEEVMIKKP